MKANSILKRLGALAVTSCMAVFSILPMAVETASAESGDAAAEAYAEQSVSYKDGTYDGSAQGYLSTIKLSVTIKDGRIAEVKELSQDETPEYWDMAKVLMDTIVEQQTADVDVVSGATYSSNGIKNAVKAALASAQEGGSTVDLSFFDSGKGTAKNPYKIKTKAQLVAFAKSVMQTDYTGVTVQLSKNISISGADWEPIGGGTNAFNGTFDGNGYAISGLTIGSASKAAVVEGGSPIGLFGILGGDAVIKNLELTKVNINVYSKDELTIGTLAGKTGGGSKDRYGTVIDSCRVQGKLTAKSYDKNVWAGGLLGYQLKGAVLNSSADVDVFASETTGGNWLEAGGLEGINVWGLIANSYATGDVRASLYDKKQVTADNAEEEAGCAVGGIVGLEYGDEVNCYAAGNVTADKEAECFGALQGSVVKGARIYNCWYKTDAKLVNAGKSVKADNVSQAINGEVKGNKGFTAAKYPAIANTLNKISSSLPLDISQYGVSQSDLKAWAYNPKTKLVAVGETVNISSYKVSGIADKVYNGTAQKQNVKVTCDGASATFTVKYSNNKKIGKATVTITGMGSFTGKVTKTFKILPAKTTVKATAGKKQLKVSCKKVEGGVKYQIALRKGNGSWKTYTVSGTSKTFKSLSSKQNYSVRVRAFKEVSGVKYYGSWSSTVTKKVS